VYNDKLIWKNITVIEDTEYKMKKGSNEMISAALYI